ncbi:nucleic acid/nucleotide deaminase domain-containing protein [Streptomyces sp. NPDC005004]
MGYTLPGWLDDVLDFIGINFPNVDEDDYREMADAMRDFADKFEGHGADAHKSVERILASSHGWAVDSMEKHWNQVKAGHLDKIPELARLFADACDVVADIIFGMKTKAEAELVVMAGSLGISAGLAVVTGGLSALIGAAEVTAMRQVIKRLIDEAVDRIVDELIARVTEPVNAKLEAMIEDAVLNMVDDAFSLPPVPTGDGGGDNAHGHHGMKLASAGGDTGLDLASSGGGSSGADLFIDHEEFEHGAGRLSTHGSELRLAGISPLGRARGAFGRTRGRDAFTQPFDAMLHGALTGCEKAMVKVGKHLRDTIPERVKATSRLHKGTDLDVEDRVKRIKTDHGEGGAASRTYILNSDGSVDKLLPGGKVDPKGLTAGDHHNLSSIIQPDGTVWRPQTQQDLRKWRTGRGHKGTVRSTRVDPSESDLAQATQLARLARDDYGAGNYAAGRYLDPKSGVESILVGYSDDRFHSERNIGHPLLNAGAKSGLKEVFTEREPCQLNPRCNKWLSYFWGSDFSVSHAADYDQSDQKTKNDQHNTYIDKLKLAHGKK